MATPIPPTAKFWLINSLFLPCHWSCSADCPADCRAGESYRVETECREGVPHCHREVVQGVPGEGLPDEDNGGL